MLLARWVRHHHLATEFFTLMPGVPSALIVHSSAFVVPPTSLPDLPASMEAAVFTIYNEGRNLNTDLDLS